MIVIERSPIAGYWRLNGIDYPKHHFGIKYDGTITDENDRNFIIYNLYDKTVVVSSRGYAEVAGVNSWDELNTLISEIGVLKNQRVLNDNFTTKPIIISMAKKVAETTLNIGAAIGDTEVTVASGAGFVVGDQIRIVSPGTDNFYHGRITGVNANVISIDTPLDNNYNVGEEVIAATTNMAVDGSVTHQVFNLRLGTPSAPSEAEMTKLVISCTATSAIDLSKFGNLPTLQKGLVLRRKNGDKSNIMNVKSNFEIAEISKEFKIYDATNPAQGLDAFVAPILLAGQENIGVAIRIGANDNIEAIVQDDLRGLSNLSITWNGHIHQK